MGDFLTRLAERTLGVAPVVQPVMPSMFASEPISYSTGLEQDSEASTSSADLDRVQAPPTQKRPTWGAPTGRPEDGAMPQEGDHRNLPPVTPGPSERTPDAPP